MLNCEGRFIPLPTPFADDGMSLSEIRMARMIRWYQQFVFGGYVVGSETGEFMTLSFSERKTVLELVYRETRGTLPLLVNVSSLSTGAAVDLAQHAGRHGARGVIALAPYFGQFSAEEESSFFKSILAYGRLPLLAVGPVQPETKLILADQATLSFGSSSSSTDRFAKDDLICEPSFAANPELPAWMGCDIPGAVLSKIALEIQGLEIGTGRPPRGRATKVQQEQVSAWLEPVLSRLSA